MVSKSLTLPIVANNEKEPAVFKLPAEIFSARASDKLLTQYTYVYLHNTKSAKGSVKTRSQVTGSTRKIYKQKGTGRARHGDIKAPIFVGGGVALGPTGEFRKLKMTKKMKRLALFYALTLKLEAKKIQIVSDKLVGAVKKTADASKLVAKFLNKEFKSAYFVLPHAEKVRPNFMNLSEVEIREPANLNAYRVMKAKQIVFSEKALSEFIALFINE